MEQGYLIDTNAAIDYLDNKLPEKSALLLDSIHSRISVISRMELLGWSNATENQEKILQSFVDSSFVYNLNEPIVLKAIELRKKYKTKLPDAIIAATALINNLILVSRNVADFRNITDLKIINPYE
jgi:predicted nucleic acid-binding protein